MKWLLSTLLLALLIYGLRPLYVADRHVAGATMSLIPPESLEIEELTSHTYILPLHFPLAPSDVYEEQSDPSAISAELLRGELRVHLSDTEQGDIRVSVDSERLRLDEQATLTPPHLIVRCELAEDEWGDDIVLDASSDDPQQLSFLLYLDIEIEEIFFRRHKLTGYWALSLDLATRQLRVEHTDGSFSAPLASFDD